MRFAAILAMIATPALAEDVVLDHDGFLAIEAREDVVVTVTVGPAFAVTVMSDHADPERLTVEQFGDWLVFSRDARWFIFPNGRQDRFEVTVTMPALTEIKAFDGAVVTATGEIGAVRAEAGGTGSLTLTDIVVSEATFVVNDGGTITAAGDCARLTVEGRAGVIDAGGLGCAAALVTADPQVDLTVAAGTFVFQGRRDD